MIYSVNDYPKASIICGICHKTNLRKAWILPKSLRICQCDMCFEEKDLYCAECLRKLFKEVNEGVAQMIG